MLNREQVLSQVGNEFCGFGFPLGRAGEKVNSQYSIDAPDKGSITPLIGRVFGLPLEGKGDRSAVDEVTCTPTPLREAP